MVLLEAARLTSGMDTHFSMFVTEFICLLLVLRQSVCFGKFNNIICVSVLVCFIFQFVDTVDTIQHVNVPVIERQPSENSTANGEANGEPTSAEASRGIDKHFTMLNGKLDVCKPVLAAFL